jgi:G3E family GTPase
MSTPLPATRVPVTILTGFLGSGKTTLLRSWLADPALANTAVLVNEFGEIGLDHDLISEVRGDMVLLQSGCICCSIRSDLVRAFCDLWVRSQRREIPAFRRVIVETTGLADPAPILATLAKNGLVSRVYYTKLLVATADGQQVTAQLRTHPEVGKQLAIADRIVLTKCDLLNAAELAAAHASVRLLAPNTQVVEGMHGAAALDAVLGELDADHQRFDDLASHPAFAASDQPDPAAELEAADAVPDAASHHAHAPSSEHVDAQGRDVATYALTIDSPLSYAAVAIWLSTLTQFYGDTLLRVKGILLVEGEVAPVVVQSVGHVVYPSYQLPTWPAGARVSRLVLIARGLTKSRLRELCAGLTNTEVPFDALLRKDSPGPKNPGPQNSGPLPTN